METTGKAYRGTELHQQTLWRDGRVHADGWIQAYDQRAVHGHIRLQVYFLSLRWWTSTSYQTQDADSSWGKMTPVEYANFLQKNGGTGKEGIYGQMEERKSCGTSFRRIPTDGKNRFRKENCLCMLWSPSVSERDKRRVWHTFVYLEKTIGLRPRSFGAGP